MSLATFCKGSVKGTVEDCENEIQIDFEVFIPIQEDAKSDDDFEIYLNDTYDKDYHEEWSDNLENAIYDSCFLDTICDYAFAVRNQGNEIIYTDNSCKIYIESSDLEWDTKASEKDSYFISICEYGVDGLPKLLTKEDKLNEIEELSDKIADIMDNDITNGRFGMHMRNAMEQDFVSDDDINQLCYEDIFNELAKWFVIVTQPSKIQLNEFKWDLARALDITLIDKDGNNYNEQLIEDNIFGILYRCFNIECEESVITDDINNFDINFEQAIKIAKSIITSKYFENNEEYEE